MHARLAQHARGQTPRVTKPLRRLLRLRVRGHTDTAAIPARGGRIARIGWIIDADLIGPRALDIGDAAAEGGGGGDGFDAEADLLGGGTGEG